MVALGILRKFKSEFHQNSLSSRIMKKGHIHFDCQDLKVDTAMMHHIRKMVINLMHKIWTKLPIMSRVRALKFEKVVKVRSRNFSFSDLE